MSTLISSAIGGKKAAPRAAPRRRPPPPATKVATPVPQSSAAASLAPPSPPQSQHRESSLPARASPVEPTTAPVTLTGPPISLGIVTPSSRDDSVPEESEDFGTVPLPSAKRARLDTSAPVTRAAKRARVDAAQEVEAQPVVVVPTTPASENDAESEQHDSTLAALSQITRKRGGVPKGRRAKADSAQLAVSESTSVAGDVSIVEAEIASPVRVGESSRRGRQKAKRSRKRAVTKQDRDGDVGNAGEGEQSDGAESEVYEIDPSTVTMWELGRANKWGKSSEREKKMQQIDWDAVKRKRLEAADATETDQHDVRETTEGPHGTADTLHPSVESHSPKAQGVQLRVVNGEIVEDEATLTVDRQAQAHAEALAAELVEEDNDLTQTVNRTTWINDRRRDVADRVPMFKSRSEAWSDADTDRFYDALKMFGTDFYIISKMFPGKTRKQIKNKFNREERLDATRVQNALLGKDTQPMNLDYYARETGRDVSDFTKYRNEEHAREVIKASLRDKEEAMKEALQVQKDEEENRQRAEEMKAGKPKKGPGSRKKKSVASLGGGGPQEDENGTEMASRQSVFQS